MTEQQQPRGFIPPAYHDALLEQIRAQARGWLLAHLRELRREDEQLRREHPWRWRAKHARRWARRRREQLARLVPIRWVGFGEPWRGWWDG